METFRCYDNSDVMATLMMTSFHLNTTVVASFPNVCLCWRSLCSDLVLILKNRIEPPSYARTAYVVAIWPSFLFDSFVKIWASCEISLGKWFTAPPLAKNFPYAYAKIWTICPSFRSLWPTVFELFAETFHARHLCTALYGDAILKYRFGPPIWPPEINKNIMIWSSLFLQKLFLFTRELAYVPINISFKTWNG